VAFSVKVSLVDGVAGGQSRIAFRARLQIDEIFAGFRTRMGVGNAVRRMERLPPAIIANSQTICRRGFSRDHFDAVAAKAPPTKRYPQAKVSACVCLLGLARIQRR
jgi:hypothetical protein